MKDNKDEQFPVVDEMGNILGAISRGHAHDGSKILHPVVHLHLFNNKGDLFLQHRPAWTCRFRRECGPGSAPRSEGGTWNNRL